jgi:hypothetical protein
MDKSPHWPDFVVAAVMAAAAFAGAGCSPRNDSSGLHPSSTQISPLEAECERELLYLDGLIETRRRNAGFPAAALAEAMELRHFAFELLLDEEYELALEFIDEAIALLKEP